MSKESRVKNAHPIAKLLVAMDEVVKRDEALNLYGPEELQYTITRESRINLARTLSDQGLSQREVARTLGVHHTTIQGYLSGGKSTAESKKSSKKSTEGGGKSTAVSSEQQSRRDAGKQTVSDPVENTKSRLPPHARVDEIGTYAHDARQKAKAAMEVVEEVADKFDQNEVDLVVETALKVANQWTQVADRARRGRKNLRSHLEVVEKG